MTDSPIDFMDAFVAEAARTDDDKHADNNRVRAPFHDEIVPGTWALYLGDIDMTNFGPDLEIQTGYLFGPQDFMALAAMTGQDYDTLIAEDQHQYELGMRFGRWYSKDNLQGELKRYDVTSLLPIDEEKAEFTRYVEFRVPVLFGATDWFKELMERAQREIEEIAEMHAKSFTCPLCGGKVGISFCYVGYAFGTAIDGSTEDDKRVLVGTVISDRFDHLTHSHWACLEPDCEYNEHIDENVWEIIKSGSDEETALHRIDLLSHGPDSTPESGPESGTD